MARRKLEDRSTRKISKHGASYSVTIPIEIMRELKWRERQRVTVKKVRGGIIIKDYKGK